MLKVFFSSSDFIQVFIIFCVIQTINWTWNLLSNVLIDQGRIRLYKLEESSVLPRSHQLSNSIPLTSNICVTYTDAKLVLQVWTVCSFFALRNFAEIHPLLSGFGHKFLKLLSGAFYFRNFIVMSLAKTRLGCPIFINLRSRIVFLSTAERLLTISFFCSRLPSCVITIYKDCLAYGWRAGNLNWPIRIQQAGKILVSWRQVEIKLLFSLEMA